MSQFSRFAVEAHDLVKVFPRGNVRALDGVSLQVEAGTVLGLLGPNGAGKTTAVRILSTILSPDSGHATILGHDVVKEADTVRRIIGLAGQYAAVDENLTGRENLRMVGRLTHMGWKDGHAAAPTSCWRVRTHRRRQPRPQDLLGRHAPPARPGRRPGGPAARPLPGRAHHRPRPPEPPGPVGRHRGAGGRRHHRAAHHPVPRGGRPAGRDIVVVDHGRVIAEGTPAELKANLGTSVISVTFERSPTSLNRRPGWSPRCRPSPARSTASIVELTVEDGPAVAADVLRTLDAARIPVAGLALREPSLDDVFLSLTGHKAEAETEEERAARKAKGPKRRGANRSVRRKVMPHDHHDDPDAPSRRPQSGHRLRWAIADTITVTWRNLIAYTRIPEALFFSTLQPIMFVLLFRYVFGGAIPIPGGVPYVDYMMPGIFVQAVMFGAVSTSVGLAEDLQKGLIERFRALPMARSAVLAGRTTADGIRNVFVIIIMTGVAFAVGFRIGDRGPRLHPGRADPAGLRLRHELGLRRHRPGRPQQRDGPGHGLPHPDAADLRLHGVRADPVHARLAPGLRPPPTGVGRHRRCPLAHGRRLLPLDQFGLVLACCGSPAC